LNADNEVEYPLEEEEEEEYTMTYLGNIIFVDKHCRQSTNESKGCIDALSFAYEDLSNMPSDIIEDFSFLYHLDISHNLFSRQVLFLTIGMECEFVVRRVRRGIFYK
jgi:hypothetical protein